MSEEAVTLASILGNLSGAGLLGLMVLALASVVIHLYKKQSEILGERQERQIRGIEDIRQNLKENLSLQKISLDAYRREGKKTLDFIKEHCKNTNRELEKISDDLESIKNFTRCANNVVQENKRAD